MHCFQCGEVLDHVDKVLFDMRYRGDLCWCHVPMIWCEVDYVDQVHVVSRHFIEFLENGVWGHTCPRHKPGPRLRGRSQAGQGRYLILPCTSDTPLVRRS